MKAVVALVLLLPVAACNAFSSPSLKPPSCLQPTLPALRAKKYDSADKTDTYVNSYPNHVSSRRKVMSFAALVTASALRLPKAQAVTQAASTNAFLATYSDPNHPGGKRTIKLLGDISGDYSLAQVYGGGGVGEPKEYVLPAVILGNRAIIIDFTPKGGPRDFTGVLENDGSIKFLRDGNRWPRIDV